MERRKFIRQCGAVGASCLGLSVLLNSCRGVRYVEGVTGKNGITINKSEFTDQGKDKISFRKYVIIRFEKSAYPIVLYRFSETEFKALLLSCTHQGNELNVNGDLISCPAHNSEFSNKGEVVQGPADLPLKSFPVTTDEKNIYIELT